MAGQDIGQHMGKHMGKYREQYKGQRRRERADYRGGYGEDYQGTLNESPNGRAVGSGWRRRFGPRRRRQAMALALAVLAIAVAARDLASPADGTVEVAVAARDVAAGTPIGDADVATTAVPEELIPDGVVPRAADIIGSTTAGPLARGEILTEPRFAGTALAQSLTGIDDAHIVAVTPRDSGLAPMLRTGDVVDVLAPGPEAGSARPVANGARVVLSGDDGVVLLALPPGAAATVASAGLDLPLTLVLSR